MLLEKPKVVIFDWDNTLVDTTPHIESAIRQMLDMYNHRHEEASLINDFHRSGRDVLPEIFGDQWETMHDVYLDLYAQESSNNPVTVMKGGKNILDNLKSQAILLGIVSNKTGDLLRQEVTSLGWDDYFFTVVGSGDTAYDKPSPSVIEYALQNQQAYSKQHIWFIGDSMVDIACANDFGCTSVLYKGDKRKQYRHQPSLCVDSHLELSVLIDQHGAKNSA